MAVGETVARVTGDVQLCALHPSGGCVMADNVVTMGLVKRGAHRLICRGRERNGTKGDLKKARSYFLLYISRSFLGRNSIKGEFKKSFLHVGV